MVIGHFNYKFGDFEMLMKQTPDLQILRICDNGNIDIIDASRWEHLITTSLPGIDGKSRK